MAGCSGASGSERQRGNGRAQPGDGQHFAWNFHSLSNFLHFGSIAAGLSAGLRPRFERSKLSVESDSFGRRQ